MWTNGLINLIYCHHWDCGLRQVQVRQAWGYLRVCEMSEQAAAYNWVLNCAPPPPRPKEEVFKVFEPTLVDSLLYAMIYFFNHGTQWGASCPWSSTLLLDLRLEAGYTFAPFGASSVWYNFKPNTCVLEILLSYKNTECYRVFTEHISHVDVQFDTTHTVGMYMMAIFDIYIDIKQLNWLIKISKHYLYMCWARSHKCTCVINYEIVVTILCISCKHNELFYNVGYEIKNKIDKRPNNDYLDSILITIIGQVFSNKISQLFTMQ